MVVWLHEVTDYLDETLDITKFRDYAPNGLQVEGRQEVECIVTGVSANLELFRAADELGADLIVVHHGLIWGGGIARVTGPVARRLGYLLERGISLAAYHLPLDFHSTLGNNAGLADAIGIDTDLRAFGDVRGHALGLSGGFSSPVDRGQVLGRITENVLGGAQPSFVFPFGPEKIRRVGLCTGAASDLLEPAAQAGCDLFITGELAERAGEIARELQVTLVAAGHYATEVFGPERLAADLARQFPGARTVFHGVPSPI